MSNARPRISTTRLIPKPTYYIKALDEEFRDWALNEERAPEYKGLWRKKVFGVAEETPLDLEIGTGNGYFFAHQAKTHPERCLLGIERKYKPLIQSIRRALNDGAQNARILRYDAGFLDHLFAPEELDKVFIHFPDPWEKKRQNKHRLIQQSFLKGLYSLQRSGALLEFKTDSRSYFDWAVEEFERSPYERLGLTYDLHRSDYAADNFVTHFERIFLQQQLPIHYALFRKSQ